MLLCTNKDFEFSHFAAMSTIVSLWSPDYQSGLRAALPNLDNSLQIPIVDVEKWTHLAPIKKNGGGCVQEELLNLKKKYGIGSKINWLKRYNIHG